MKNLIITFFIFALSIEAFAHQPIMDMAPRWNNGYGIQIRTEKTDNQTIDWLEGVYTFKPSVRMTLKVPSIDEDIGDSIFAVPLKRYSNQGGFTSNIGITPSLRIPTGGGSKWDVGLSLSYSSETPTLYQLYDLYTLRDTTGFDLNVGLVHANGRGSSLFTLWDISALHSNSRSRILTGPMFVYFKKNIVGRVVYKFPVHNDDDTWEGNFLELGLGIVF